MSFSAVSSLVWMKFGSLMQNSMPIAVIYCSEVEINMHHLRGTMQYRQAHWATFWAIFFTKLGIGQGVPGPYPHEKLHGCSFKTVGLQASKLVIFGINLSHRGISPYEFFLQNLAWERVSHVPMITLTFDFVALKCGLMTAKIAKNSNFWYIYLPIRKNPGGR